MSDVTGVLEHHDDTVVTVRRDGETLSIPGELVVSMRVLSDTPVRISAIRSLEWAAGRAWPGLEQHTADGWLLRAGLGHSRRANSAVPVDRHATLNAASVAAIGAWYRERRLPAMITVVERVIPAAHIDPTTLEMPTAVMVRSLDPIPGAGVGLPITLADQPSDAWVRTYAGSRDCAIDVDGWRSVLCAVRDGVVGFASVEADGELIACGRAAVTADGDGVSRLGITALWTAASRRGTGIGSAVTDRLLAWGRGQGAESAYLQVELANTDAIRLYRRLGFTRHHTYGYHTL
ncbi:GNAT family N-acetyltransferase [Williamsia sp. CHRR-6]|nr:GNAT family N-acetyltransferase [Williamsia sp. CHRR-6]